MNLVLVFTAVGLLCASLAAGAGPLVNLTYAQYEGVYNATTGINTWLGIRYAQAPTGPLRWQPPLDIELSNNYSSMGAINATVYGPTCVQGNPFFQNGANGTVAPTPTGAEDCLLLDVNVPAHPVSSSLPVLVQIHGGGYTIGSSGLVPGDALVAQSNGSLIYVATQYRLGVFGFLSSSEIKDNGVPNAGLLDMRAALSWVQRNIRAFGGDPSKVTIVGGSAGGGAVMNQMILYGGVSNPPFRAVISEYPWWQPYHNNTVLEVQYRELLTATGCANLACLRGLSQQALMTASEQTYTAGFQANPSTYGFGDFYYGPSVDGEIIRDLPSNEFKKGHFTKVPLLVDRDEYEGVDFSNTSLTTVAEETADLQVLFPYAKPSFFTRLYQLYPAASFNSTFFQRSTLYGDFIISCPTYYMASSVADAGQPVYKLIFDAGSELHGASDPFLFSATIPTTTNNNTLAQIMRDWYISFATNLDPNAKSYTGIPKPYWPTYNSASGNFSVMDVNYTMLGVTPDFDASPQCDFFHGQSYVVRN